MNEIYKYIKRLITRRQSRIVILVMITTLVAWAAYLRLVNGYIWADGTGFEGKTLWDWLGLFIIPLVLASIAIWFNKTERENELILAEKRAEVDRRLAADRIQEETLQAYFDKITELLLDKKLLQAEPHSDSTSYRRSTYINHSPQIEWRTEGYPSSIFIVISFNYIRPRQNRIPHSIKRSGLERNSTGRSLVTWGRLG